MLLSYVVLLVFLELIDFSHQLGDKLLNISVAKSSENKNELIYTNQIELAAEQSAVVTIDGFDNANFGFAILQVHSFYYNVSVSTDSDSFYGSNIGFIVRADNVTKILHLLNKNHDTMHCMVALIGYVDSAPIPGGCSMDDNSTLISAFETEEREHFLFLTIPPATESLTVSSCENSEPTHVYTTFYLYIDALDFTVESYFNALKKMLFTNMFTSYRAKNISRSRTHLFEAIAGRGLIINTAVTARNGETAFYVPFVTYSCPPNTWLAHCLDINFLKRSISIVMVIHSVMMMLNLMVPDFIESILNGLLFGGFVTIAMVQSNDFPLQHFDYFLVVIVVALFFGALLGTISLYLPIGRYLSKLTFCNLLVVFVVECFFENVTTITLQCLLAFIFSIILSYSTITYAAFLGGLVLILNISYLIKYGNLHRIVINNFLAFTTVPAYSSDSFFDYIRPNYINYRVSLNTVDYVLLVFYIFASIYLTIRKEQYFFENPAFASADSLFPSTSEVDSFNCENARRRQQNCIIGIRHNLPSHQHHRIISRSRRLHRVRPQIINERTPLISHWLTSEEGDDDVFETPATSRYLEILSAATSDNTYHDEDFNEIQSMDA